MSRTVLVIQEWVVGKMIGTATPFKYEAQARTELLHTLQAKAHYHDLDPEILQNATSYADLQDLGMDPDGRFYFPGPDDEANVGFVIYNGQQFGFALIPEGMVGVITWFDGSSRAEYADSCQNNEVVNSDYENLMLYRTAGVKDGVPVTGVAG